MNIDMYIYSDTRNVRMHKKYLVSGGLGLKLTISWKETFIKVVKKISSRH